MAALRVWKTLRRGAGAAMLIAGLLLPAQALAQADPSGSSPPPDRGAQAFDVLVLRPLGLAGALVGTALFVPVAILTSPGGKDTIEEALELFVLEPGKFVFTRPLGSF